jgi:glycine/D-amino acid oxidase-like deaminating enzyme
MTFTPYWLDTAPAGSPERSDTSVEGRTDVAVIGGGPTGVVAALHLADSGAKVDLFDWSPRTACTATASPKAASAGPALAATRPRQRAAMATRYRKRGDPHSQHRHGRRNRRGP